MIDDNVLHGFLEKLAKDAMKQIKEEGQLSQQNALPFLIKDQYQKIHHIESEFATKKDIENLEHKLTNRIDDLDNRINELDTRLTNRMDDFRNDIFRELKQYEKITRIYFGILATLIIFCLGKLYI